MCGIHGIVSYCLSKKELAERLHKMERIQLHRGPDDQRSEIYLLNHAKIGFGFVRLSILDLKTGMQPIICPVDKSAIICNGQIYNYLELRNLFSSEMFTTKGDIEVALALYRKSGLEFLQFLNGMYAGAIFDPQKQKLILFRDRFGIKPLYYTEHDNNFIFASEIKAVFQGSQMKPVLNTKGLGTFFSYRYLPGQQTMFKKIKRVPPGSFLEYDLEKKKYQIIRYWEYNLDRENHLLSLQDAQDKFYSLFSDAVRIRLRSDVEVGSLLSGGIDSSAVAASTQTIKSNVKLFTISFSEPKYDELYQVKKFIRNRPEPYKHYHRCCGKEILQLLPDIIDSIEDPVSLGAILPTYQVCKLASEHVKVVLTGEGADEIFGGYRKFLIEMAALSYPQLKPEKQKNLMAIYPELADYLKIRFNDPRKRYIQAELLFTTQELKDLIGVEYTDDDILPFDALPHLKGTEHPLNAAIAMESRFRLPDYVIVRLDKLSMRHSLEARTPFLDYRVAEFAATLPVKYKVNLEFGQGKFICRQSFYKNKLLDNNTAFRTKQPFTIPMAQWFADTDNLPDFLKEIIYGDVIKQQGILDYKSIGKIFNSISEKNVGPATLVSNVDKMFAVLIFTLWYSKFF